MYTPAGGGGTGRAVVVCPPLGQEMLRAHRTLRILAERLAGTGHDVLRFDYYGTGESAGDGHEVTLAGCVDDAREAVDEIRDLTGAHRVSLVGFRLGALVAARAAAHPRVDRLVLCDPVLDGPAYLSRLGDDAKVVQVEGRGLWVRGFPLPEGLRRELEEARVPPAPLPTDRTLAVTVVDPVARVGEVERVDGAPYWIEGEGISVGAVPVPLVSRVVEWHG